jgi:hypothetical protein
MPMISKPKGEAKYIFHSDPGHGWLAVKYTELESLGILNKISGYSYVKGGTVYLEEDCDLSAFVTAKEAKGEAVTYRESYQEHTPIRGYDRFKIH